MKNILLSTLAGMLVFIVVGVTIMSICAATTVGARLLFTMIFAFFLVCVLGSTKLTYAENKRDDFDKDANEP